MTDEPMPPERKYTPEETAARRAALLEGPLLDYVRGVFAADDRLRSATLLVAQFWNDEADDAVHAEWVFSYLEAPVIDTTRDHVYYDADDRNLAGGSQYDVEHLVREEPDRPSGPTWWRHWDANNEAIALFAAYCPEGANQQDETLAHHGRLATYVKDGDRVTVEIASDQIRPWLDGVRPSYDWR